MLYNQYPNESHLVAAKRYSDRQDLLEILYAYRDDKTNDEHIRKTADEWIERIVVSPNTPRLVFV